MASVNILDDIMERRNVASTFPEGGLPHRFIELLGGEIVEVTAFEPDARTSDMDFYYNARDNVLYKRIKSRFPHWMRVTDYH
ncbi:MAG: hypothetical protein GF411_14315 [Candidatus Lokiarchaeota archaeon]|nr:hypothetical protein [Candidatus Lokiarchaeota archaeon]